MSILFLILPFHPEILVKMIFKLRRNDLAEIWFFLVTNEVVLTIDQAKAAETR